MAPSTEKRRPAETDLHERLDALLKAHASLFPASLLAGDPAVVLGPATLNDVNDIADGVLGALAPIFQDEETVATFLPDPAVMPVAGSRGALVLLVAALIRQVTLTRPLAADMTPAIDVVTGQAGDQVALEINRVGVEVRGAVRPLEDLSRLLTGLLNGDLGMVAEREEVTAAVRLPAVPWGPVAGEVLVLEHEPVVREVIWRILAHSGIVARALGSVEDLEARLETAPPALLLIAASFADRRRGLVVEWLASFRPELVERIVLLTGSPTTVQARRALAALRREWYLAKPFAAETLVALVRRRLMCLASQHT